MKKGDCRHFNGTMNECCEAGVNYRELAGHRKFGMALAIPCLKRDEAEEKRRKELNIVPAECPKREEVTKEDLAERDAFIKQEIRRVMKVQPLIAAMKEEFKGRSGKKVVKCPVCKGRLHMSIASVNGHVWGKCETADCLAWME